MKSYLAAAVFVVMTTLSAWFAYDINERVTTLERHDHSNLVMHDIENARINALRDLPTKKSP